MLVNAQASHVLLAGELFVSKYCPCAQARLAEGIISLLTDYISAGIGHHRG